jgi:hypothetical protein
LVRYSYNSCHNYTMTDGSFFLLLILKF